MRWLTRLFAAAISGPSLAVAAVNGGLALHHVGQRQIFPSMDGWDVLLTRFTQQQSVPVILLLAWIPTVIQSHRRLLREDDLIRRGTWAGATRAVLAVDSARFCGALALSMSVVVAVGLPLGFGPGWSRFATAPASGGVVAVEGGASLAQFFASPVYALIVQALWLGIGAMMWSALHLGLLLRIRKRLADVVLVGGGIYGAIEASGILGDRTFPDMAAWTNASWAMTSPASLAWTVLVWVGAAWLLWDAVRRRDAPVSGEATRGAKGSVVVVGAALAVTVLYSWMAYSRAGGFGGPGTLTESAFGGAHSSLFGYVVGLLPLLTVTSLIAHRLAELDSGRMVLVLLRHGSTARWLPRVGARAVAAVVGVALLTVGLTWGLDLVLSSTALDQESVTAFSEDPGLALGVLAAGYLLVGLLLLGLVFLLYWVTGSVQAWPVVLLAVLLLGYPWLVGHSRWNPLSAYSIESGFPPVPMDLVAPGVAVVLIVAAVAVLIGRNRVPGHR